MKDNYVVLRMKKFSSKAFWGALILLTSLALVSAFAQEKKNGKKISVKLLWHKKIWDDPNPYPAWAVRIGRPEIPKAFKNNPEKAPYHYVKSIISKKIYFLDKSGNVNQVATTGGGHPGAFISDNGEYVLVISYEKHQTKKMTETSLYTMYNEDGNILWKKEGVFTLQAYVSNQGDVAALSGEWFWQSYEKHGKVMGMYFYDQHGKLKGSASLSEPFEVWAPEWGDSYFERAQFSESGKNFFLRGSRFYCLDDTGNILGVNDYSHLITAVSGDGRFVAVVGKLFNERCVEIPLPELMRIYAFSPDGNYFAGYSWKQSGLMLVETKTLKKVWEIQEGYGTYIDISSNANLIAAGGIALFDKNGTRLWYEKRSVGKTKISKNGKYFITSNSDGIFSYEILEK